MKHYHFSKSDTSIAKLIAITLMLLHHLFGFTDRILPENMYHSIYIFLWKSDINFYCAGYRIFCFSNSRLLAVYRIIQRSKENQMFS